MRKTLLSLLALGFLGCSTLPHSPTGDPWKRNEKKPERVVILLLNGLETESEDSAVLPHFQRLKSHSLNFHQAWLGHLFSNPSVSNLVLTTGRLPKHLPWDDSISRDKKRLSTFSTADFSRLLSPVSTSLLKKISGPANSKLVIAPQIDQAFPLAAPTTESRILTGTPPDTLGPETWVTNGILSFFQSEPQWRAVLASFGNRPGDFVKSDQQLGRILDYLEQKNLLSETAIVFTSHPKEFPLPAKSLLKFRELLKDKKVTAGAAESMIRFYLSNPETEAVLKFASQLKSFPQLAEIYYKKEVSGRFHYIRIYRSPDVEGSRLEWAKNQLPILLTSLASKRSADVLAVFQDYSQQVPLLVWSPNLRIDTPVIKNQIEQNRMRFVDIHPLVLELLGLPPDASLDGSSLGIKSLIY